MARRRTDSEWRIDGDVFIKRYSSNLESEIAKAHAMYEASTNSEFRSPRVLHVDLARSEIHFELIGDTVSSRIPYLNQLGGRPMGHGHSGVFARIGEALADFHRKVSPEHTTPWDPSVQSVSGIAGALRNFRVDGPDDLVSLHGDFGFSNVLLTRTNPGQVVLVDGSPNGYSTHSPVSKGSRYIDVASYLACLQGLVPAREYLRIDRRGVPRIKSAFLSAYEYSAEARLDRAALATIEHELAAAYLRVRFPNRFARNLSTRLLYARSTTTKGTGQDEWL